MSIRTAFKTLHLARETGYADDPRPADSAYLAIPTAGELELADERQILETNRNTGRPGMSPAVPGPGQGSLTFNSHLLGLAAQGGDGDSPSADDWLDLIFDGLGIQAERDGEGVTSHSGTSLTLDSDTLSAWDLAPLEDSGGTLRWAFVSVDNADGSYTLNSDPGITATLCRAFRQFADADGSDDTDTLAGAFIRDGGSGSDIESHLPGCRITGLTIQAQAGQLATMSVTMQADDVESDDFTFTTGTNGDPAVTVTSPLRLACVYLDGTEVPVSQISIDFGVEAAPRSSTCEPNGRADHLLIAATPTITVQPQYAASYETEKRNQDQKEIIIAFQGGGDDSSRQLAFGAPEVQLQSHAPTDASGLLEASLVYAVKTVGDQARWVIARC